MFHYNRGVLTWKFLFLNLIALFISFSIYGDGKPQEAVQPESEQHKEIKDYSIKKVAISITVDKKRPPCGNCIERTPPPEDYISVEKTQTGAIAKYRRPRRKDIDVEFNAEEWQNFIKAFSKLRINEWERDYGGWGSKYGTNWGLEVTSSEKIELRRLNAEPQYREYTFENYNHRQAKRCVHRYAN